MTLAALWTRNSTTGVGIIMAGEGKSHSFSDDGHPEGEVYSSVNPAREVGFHKEKCVLRSKVVFAGAPHVGKTSLCQVFQSGGHAFPKSYLMTLGVDFSVKEVQVTSSEETFVEMHVFDTGGQSVYNQRELGCQYVKNASVAVFVYDAGSQQSFLECSKWVAAVRSENSGKPVPGLLVANKMDLRESGRIKVSSEEGQTFARENGLTFFQASALRNEGVDEIFSFIADAFFAKYRESINSITQAL